MADIQTSLQTLGRLSGVLGVALVDYESGMCLGSLGDPGFDLELAAAGSSEVVRAKKNIRDKLKLRDRVEEVLSVLETQYHLIRMVGTTMFFYVVLDRSKSNLALARRELQQVEKEFQEK